MDITVTEQIELLEIRMQIYNFLSTVFRCPPGPEQMHIILEQDLFADFPLEIEESNYLGALSALAHWSNQSKELDLSEVVATLRRDYTQLFIGPGHLPAPPWESVYRSEERLTFGEQTLEVRECYRRHGLQFVLKNNEPDDHFGLELEFMAYLSNAQLQALAENNLALAGDLAKEQLAFLNEHILKWSKDFLKDVSDNANTGYYQGVALLTQSFLEWDYACLTI